MKTSMAFASLLQVACLLQTGTPVVGKASPSDNLSAPATGIQGGQT